MARPDMLEESAHTSRERLLKVCLNAVVHGGIDPARFKWMLHDVISQRLVID